MAVADGTGTDGQTATSPGTATPPYAATLLVSGDEWHSALTYDGRVPLSRPDLYIGQLEVNDLVLSDPTVLRLHAAIHATADGYELEDLGSTNGTFVEGRRITGPTRLQPGQRIRLGATTLLFQKATLEGADKLAPAVPSTMPASLASLASPASPASPTPTLAAGASRRTSSTTARPGLVSSPDAPPVQRAGASDRRDAPDAPDMPEGAVSTAVVALPASAFANTAVLSLESPFKVWLKRQIKRRYWRIFLVGLAAYLVSLQALQTTDNPHLVPLVMLLASTLVPVCFVVFCWEAGAFVDMPLSVVGLTFISGGVLGLLLAAILEPTLVLGSGFGAALGIGLCEESAKAVAVAWFLRDRRVRSELDGLVLGAAAGMGFSALETAGYGFDHFLTGFVAAAGPTASPDALFMAGVHAMTGVLMLRMAFAVFGHGVWTAIICAALWRERGHVSLRQVSGVALAFAIAVVLHALWDTADILVPISGLIGLVVLRFLLAEAVERAKLGAAAPPPLPLAEALTIYVARLCQRLVQRLDRLAPKTEPTAK